MNNQQIKKSFTFVIQLKVNEKLTQITDRDDLIRSSTKIKFPKQINLLKCHFMLFWSQSDKSFFGRNIFTHIFSQIMPKYYFFVSPIAHFNLLRSYPIMETVEITQKIKIFTLK